MQVFAIYLLSIVLTFSRRELLSILSSIKRLYLQSATAQNLYTSFVKLESRQIEQPVVSPVPARCRQSFPESPYTNERKPRDSLPNRTEKSPIKKTSLFCYNTPATSSV